MEFKVDQGTKNNSLCNSIAGFARVGGNWCDGSVLHSQLKLLSYQGKIRTKVYLLCSFEDLSVLKKNSFTLPHLIITGVHILFLASFTLQLSKLKKSQQKLPIRLRLPCFFAYSLPICRANLFVRRIRIEGFNETNLWWQKLHKFVFSSRQESAKPTTKRLAKGTNNDHS